MATEIETKLRVNTPELLEEILNDPTITQYIEDEYVTQSFSSRYFDTADGILAQRKWTLRLREEGIGTIAAMKTASSSQESGIFTRGEWQCKAKSLEEAVPVLVEQGAPRELLDMLRGKQLIEQCGARFSRKSAILYMPDGVRVEIAGDTGVLCAGDRTEPLCELELELLFGDALVMPPLCQKLMEDYGLEAEDKSKYQRAKALADTKS